MGRVAGLPVEGVAAAPGPLLRGPVRVAAASDSPFSGADPVSPAVGSCLGRGDPPPPLHQDAAHVLCPQSWKVECSANLELFYALGLGTGSVLGLSSWFTSLAGPHVTHF